MTLIDYLLKEAKGLEADFSSHLMQHENLKRISNSK